MRTKRKYFKTPRTRPRKKPGARRRRQLEHRNRLIGLGVEEEKVARMNPKQIRDLLKYPKKVVQSLEAEAK
ncbi:MAG: hypothetical protein AAF226_00185 [Verrucomicrobiota bacterium]